MSGIEDVNGKIYCANCKKLICSNTENVSNYCEKCGSALSFNAIQEKENKEYAIKQKVVRRLNQIASDGNSNNFAEIIKEYIDELN